MARMYVVERTYIGSVEYYRRDVPGGDAYYWVKDINQATTLRPIDALKIARRYSGFAGERKPVQFAFQWVVMRHGLCQGSYHYYAEGTEYILWVPDLLNAQRGTLTWAQGEAKRWPDAKPYRVIGLELVSH